MIQENLKKTAITNLFWRFLERFLAKGVTLIVTLVLARILSPTDYGVVSIVTIFFLFANVIAIRGLDTALVQKKDADINDYSTVLTSSLIISLFLYMIIFILAPYIAILYENDSITNLMRVMGLILPVNALNSIICAYVSSTFQFKKFFFATLFGTVLSAFVGIEMAVNGYGAWSLVAQQMTNMIVDTLILLIITRFKIRFKFSVSRFKSLNKFGWKVFASSLLDLSYEQISPMIIGIKYNSADLSFYTKGQMIPNALTGSINSTLSSVFFPILSKVQEDKEKLLAYTRLFIRLSSYVVFPLLLGFFAISDNFVMLILTEKWAPVIPYIKIFCISSMFIMIATGNCETIKAMGRSDVFLKMEVLKKISYFTVIFLFIYFSKTPLIIAFSSIACTIISIIVNTYPNRKLLGYSYKKQLFDLLPNLIISIIMSIAVSLFNMLQINRILLMIIQVFVGILVYLILSIFAKNSSFIYLKDLIKKFLETRRKRNEKTNN